MDSPSHTILVVDDHVELAENLAEILESAGYATAVADSATAALARLSGGNISALLTDFRLSDQDGADLIVAARRTDSRLPALVMSAYTDSETVGKATRAGASSFLAKPVNVEELLFKIGLLFPAGVTASA